MTSAGRLMGGSDLHGKAAAREALEAMKDVVTRELVIDSIITQGREGAISGVIKTERGGSVAFLRCLPLRMQADGDF